MRVIHSTRYPKYVWLMLISFWAFKEVFPSGYFDPAFYVSHFCYVPRGDVQHTVNQFSRAERAGHIAHNPVAFQLLCVYSPLMDINRCACSAHSNVDTTASGAHATELRRYVQIIHGKVRFKVQNITGHSSWQVHKRLHYPERSSVL